MPRFVIYNPDWGVYLGSFLGLGFWSKLDAAGQLEAVTFASRSEIEGVVSGWECRPDRYVAVPVATGSSYATMPEIAEAGLPVWSP